MPQYTSHDMPREDLNVIAFSRFVPEHLEFLGVWLHMRLQFGHHQAQSQSLAALEYPNLLVPDMVILALAIVTS